MKGLIIIAHGSKKDLSNNEVFNLANEIKNSDKNFDEIKAAFLEFATPNIHTIVNKYIKSNISQIYFYPYFLNSGRHVCVDLPNIINDLKLQYPKINFLLLEHFGKSNKISDIIKEDINSSIIKSQ